MGEGIGIGRELGAPSYHRDEAPLTVKREEWALEDADVRREAWYARLDAWKAVEGEGGAEMVGEDEVSMSRLRRGAAAVNSGNSLALGLRLQREVPAGVGPSRHSRRQCRGEGGDRWK